MPSCAAAYCRSQAGKGSGRTLHRFPLNSLDRQKWILITCRENWVPGKRSVLCSDHFEEECFDRTGQITRLRYGAIPTKGKFAPHQNKERVCRSHEDDIKRSSLADDSYDICHSAVPNITSVPEDQISVKSEPWDPSDYEMDPGERIICPQETEEQFQKQLILHRENTEASLALNSEPLQPEELSRPDDLQPSEDPSALQRYLSAQPEDPFYSDHYYCRKPEQTEELMQKRDVQVQYLRMKLQYLEENDMVEEEPPDWSQFKRSMPDNPSDLDLEIATSEHQISDDFCFRHAKETSHNLEEKDRQVLRLLKKIKTLQQKKRRAFQKKKEKQKAKIFRYLVMIEPSEKNGKTTSFKPLSANDHLSSADNAVFYDPSTSEESTLEDSIESHKASLVAADNCYQEKPRKPFDILQEKEKEIQDLRKKLQTLQQIDRSKTTQIAHLHEVIQILKGRPELQSHQKEFAQGCSFCQLRTHRVTSGNHRRK